MNQNSNSTVNASEDKDVNKNDNLDNKNDFILNKECIGTDYSYKHEVVWKNAIGFLIMHLLAVWGLILALTGEVKFNTILLFFFSLYVNAEAVTVGAHRFYTHRSFKAKPSLRALFVILQTLTGENCVFIWARDHRLHHRYSDTDGDPHNAKRGFFFCHIGWLMCKKHPKVIELGRQIDMSDLQADWMVMFQKKYYYYLYFIIALLIPVAIPVYCFGETWPNSILVSYFLRYVVVLNSSWLVNSFAHIYGTRPYDKNLQPVESWFVSLLTLGEGWHNYHHTFPWDYKAAELTTLFNYSAELIKFFERIGLAWDLKTASPEVVDKRIVRTGDGTHYRLGTDETKAAVTAIGPVHPLNPFYTTTLKAPEPNLEPCGLPLFHEKDVFDVKTMKRETTSG